MEEINELIERFRLEEDSEHIIIPLAGKNGVKRRCFILKRRYIRIAYPEERYVDYPLAVVVEATIKHPDIPLSEAIHLLDMEATGRVLEESGAVGEPSESSLREDVSKKGGKVHDDDDNLSNR